MIVSISLRLWSAVLLLSVVGCTPSPSSSIFDSVDTPNTGEQGDNEPDDEVGGDGSTDSVPSVTSSILELKSHYIGSTTKLIETMTIYAQVVANDIRDEFTYTMILEDATGGIEVSVDLDNIAYSFALGCWVRVVCDDLWLGSRGGTIVLGEEPTGDDVVDMIDEDDVTKRIYYSDQGSIPYPTFVTIGALNSSLVSCFVAIKDLRFLTSEGSTFCARDPDTGRSVSTTHILESRDGEQIELYVASTTKYADDLIPDGYGVVYAILDLYAGEYSIRLIDRGIDF